MQQALRLANKHKGQTGDNPSVGCVLVKNGKVIGSAVTAVNGRPHAETQALKIAGPDARGATAYVTLEPCSHHGHTGPCATALIEAKILRCVIAAIDPDPRVNWRGAAMLQEAGIDTQVGLLSDKAAEIMDDFFKRARSKA